MLKRYHHIVGGIFRFTDAFVIGLAWLMAYAIRFYTPWIEITKGMPLFSKYASLTPFIITLWMLVFSSFKVYPARRMLKRTHEAFLLLKAHGVALLFLVAITYFFSEYHYSRVVLAYFALIGAFGIVIFRLILRNSLREMRRRGYNLRHVIAIGEGNALETLIYRLDHFPELGLRITGIITRDHSSSERIAGKPVLGHFGQTQNIIERYQPDQIVISLPRHQYTELDRILNALKDETIDLQLIPDIHEYITLGCEIEDFDGLPIVHLNDSPLHGWGAIAKRITDIILSGIALILLAPFLALIALAIKIFSPGPILYSQERMGLDGRTFRILKFRSMRVDAEQSTGAVWAQQHDPRRTRFGTFLRSTSLDELPQFWNVLIGDMSLVGPRPERPVFVHQFRNDIPHYMLRHKVKAGITGWAQVNGWRGNTSLDRRIECDLYYIRHWSYLLDIKILIMTVWKGFIHRNAY